MVELTSKMTVKQINAKLKAGGEFTFKKGTYPLNDTIVLRSNTKVECEQGTIFEKAKTSVPAVATYSTATTKVFKGAHDVLWKGGEFRGTKTAQKSMFRLFHAQNVEVSDVKIAGKTDAGCGCVHYIEINACKNVAVLDCDFERHVTQKGKEYKEVVQIDYAYYDGIPDAAPKGSACFDHTHCRDIKIMGCKFTACPTAIGTHTRDKDTDKFHKGLKIERNDAIGTRTGNFVNLYNMRDVNIADNYAIGFEMYARSRGSNSGMIDNSIELKA